MRRRWQRAQHGAILRGQVHLDTFQAVAESLHTDCELAVSRARTLGERARRREVANRAEERSKQFFAGAVALTGIRLADGESSAHRTETLIEHYLSWRAAMSRTLEELRSPPESTTQRLRNELSYLLDHFSPLQLGIAIYAGLPESTYITGGTDVRIGKVFAAELAWLALRGHVWFHFGGPGVNENAIMATRNPDVADPRPLMPEEQALLDFLFAGAEETGLAEDRPGRLGQAKQAIRLARHRLAEQEVGKRHVRERARLVRSLTLVDSLLRSGPGDSRWDTDPELRKTAYPLAVLFAQHIGPGGWLSPPEEELFIPSLLPLACTLAAQNVS
ncbi:hypothetical protein [Streptomyces sp. V2I9]|uniref:hypothetical protein n=1 Tax=Streptomyces sp. V2I9 TaxID=3042304 RepID=UPI0027D7FA43|nr:hypothetical protein [Streptomyces sp. V2I9]